MYWECGPQEGIRERIPHALERSGSWFNPYLIVWRFTGSFLIVCKIGAQPIYNELRKRSSRQLNRGRREHLEPHGCSRQHCNSDHRGREFSNKQWEFSTDCHSTSASISSGYFYCSCIGERIRFACDLSRWNYSLCHRAAVWKRGSFGTIDGKSPKRQFCEPHRPADYGDDFKCWGNLCHARACNYHRKRVYDRGASPTVDAEAESERDFYCFRLALGACKWKHNRCVLDRVVDKRTEG